MHLRRSRLGIIASIMVSAGAILGVSPIHAGALTAPSLQVQVQPSSTNLVDGQVITVTGSGFTPNAEIGVYEAGCCGFPVTFTTATSSGTFSTPIIVTRYFLNGSSTTDCAVAGNCNLIVGNIANLPSQSVTIPLTFDPSSPPAPPPVIGATLSPTGSVNHKTGVATLSGTVTCNRPVFVDVQGSVSQTSHHVVSTSSFTTRVLCTSSGTWSAVVNPPNVFVQGTMSVSASFVGDVYGTSPELDGSSVNLSGSVTLKEAKS